MKIKETYKTKEKIMNNSLTEEQVKVLNMSQSVINEVRKVIIGKDEIIIKALLSILAGGHILIEDIPGVGKPLLPWLFQRRFHLTIKDYNSPLMFCQQT